MAGYEQVVLRDPALFYWILLPITIVMVLTGILRHYATVLMSTPPKPPTSLAEYRERLALLRGVNFRTHASSVLTPSALQHRKSYLRAAYCNGDYLKNPDARGKGAPNPMTDPAGMDAMMGMMKGNMAMMIPQTLIMGWINAFFSGFVILKLPFPLTIRFKSMLQSGVMTRDLDVRWVSSLSWYFLNLFGLQPVFNFILGGENGAGQMTQQPGPVNLSSNTNPFGPGQDPDKMFLAEAENLDVMEHFSILDGIEERLLQTLATV